MSDVMILLYVTMQLFAVVSGHFSSMIVGLNSDIFTTRI
jgi:hypothetical protein